MKYNITKPSYKNIWYRDTRMNEFVSSKQFLFLERSHQEGGRLFVHGRDKIHEPYVTRF